MDDKRFEELLKSSFDEMTPEQLDRLGGINMKKRNVLGIAATGLATAAACGIIVAGAVALKGGINHNDNNNNSTNIGVAQSSNDGENDKDNANKDNNDTDNKDNVQVESWGIGEWSLDIEKTTKEAEQDVDLFLMFGTGLREVGATVVINEDGTFTYTLALAQYANGTYSYSEDGKKIIATGEFETGDQSYEKQIEFEGREIDGETYLVSEYKDPVYELNLYWSMDDASDAIDHADAVIKPENCVTDSFAKNGTYKDEVGNVETYDFRIPQFVDDTGKAAELNARIKSELEFIINPELQAMEEKCSLDYTSVTYDVIDNNDWVSIFVTVNGLHDDVYYYSYTYDYRLGEEVSNERILESCAMDSESFAEVAILKTEEVFNATYPDSKDSEEAKRVLEKVKEEINSDAAKNAAMYTVPDGTLTVALPVASLAGPDCTWKLIEFTEQ